jgi:alkylhydroperoxidase family enzyme
MNQTKRLAKPRSGRPSLLLSSCPEWTQHRFMPAEAGVDEHRVAELPMWRTSPAFTEAERAALALTDALVDGHVLDEFNATIDEHFGPKARVELTLTAAFYCAVPRLLDALRVPVEGSTHAPSSQEDSEEHQA